MKIFPILLVCFLFAIVSCEKDSNDVPSKDFIEITVNGQTYSNDLTNNGMGFSGQGGCDTKEYFTALLGQIDVSTLFLNVYIKHYGNDIDFKPSKPGEYGLTALAGYDVSALLEGCNLNLGICFSDKTQSTDSTTMQSGSIHNVTNVKEVERNSTNIGYSVSGTFSCTFKNSKGEIIHVTGKYQTTLYALK